jgi:hypothetical protein
MTVLDVILSSPLSTAAAQRTVEFVEDEQARLQAVEKMIDLFAGAGQATPAGSLQGRYRMWRIIERRPMRALQPRSGRMRRPASISS